MTRNMMNCFKLFALVLVTACLATVVVPAQAGPIPVDNFAAPSPGTFWLLPVQVNPSKVLSTTTAGAIGGQRDIMTNTIGQSVPDSLQGFIGFDNSKPIDALQIGTNGTSPTVTTLQYSGTNNTNTLTSLNNNQNINNGLGIDITGGGSNDHFQFNFRSSDAQPTTGLRVSIALTSPLGGASATVPALVNPVPNSQAPFIYTIPFSALSGNVDLTHVTSLVFVFNGPQGNLAATNNVDFTIQQIMIVPEPASLSLGGAALLAFCAAAYGARRYRTPSPSSN